MSRANPIQVSFSAGELSPRMLARVDRPQYANGCYRMRNFIPDLAGPAIKRGGTRYVNNVKFSAQRAWLVRFEMTATDSYILEFGHFYIRFYKNRSQLGPAYEIASPWSEASLINADGALSLSFIQSADIIYIAHRPSNPAGATSPRKLSRFGDTNWTLTPYEPTGGPFENVNIGPVFVSISAQSGSITVGASAPLFSSSNIGQLFYIEQPTITNIAQWEAGKAVAINQYRRVGSRVYRATTAATTGTVTPIHTEGTVSDGDTGVLWAFEHAGYGYGRITAVASATSATMQVQSLLPHTVIATQSSKWAFGAWGGTSGYPTHVTFYQDRLVWARGQQVWMTVASDYENMLDRDAGGRQTVESSISMFVPSRRGSGTVWLEPLEQQLLVGTGHDEWVIAPASRNEPVGPLNISVFPMSTIGSKAVPIIRMFDSIVFAQRSGKKLRDLKYTTQDGLQRIDLNILADHILGPGVVSMTHAKEPNSLLLAVRSDGKLAVAMYYPEQDLLGWALWETDGVIECAETILSPDGLTNDVWLIVRRTVNGSDVRYVEYLRQPIGDDDFFIEQAVYVDSAVVLQAVPPASAWPNAAPHLANRTINALLDGNAVTLTVAANGSITTPFPVNNLIAGLAYSAVLASMDMDAGAPAGTAQNKQRRIHRMGVRLHRARGGLAGPSLQKLEALRYTQPGQPPLTNYDLFTGDVDFSMPGGTEKTCRAWFVHSEAMPATVLAFIPQLQTDDIS